MNSSLILYKRLLSYLWPIQHLFWLSILGFILFGLANIAFPDLIGTLIDEIGKGQQMDPFQRISVPLTLIAIIAFRGFGSFVGSYCMSALAFKVIHKLRTELLSRMLKFPLAYIERQSSGHLISTVTYNVAQIAGAVSEALAVLLREGATILFIVAYLLYLNWMLTLVFVAITPIISLVVLYASRKFRKHSKRIQASMGDVTHILNEALKGIKVIRVFGAQDQTTTHFSRISELNTIQNLKLSLTSAVAGPIIQLLVGAALAILLWLAMDPDALGSISSGEFVAFITAAGMLLKPVRQTSKVNADIQKGLAAAASIFDLIDEKNEDDSGQPFQGRVEGSLSFRDVSFAYDKNNDNVLNRINLEISAGLTVAFVGASGSGKSTLINLLPRFYSPKSGEILLDGKSIKEYLLKDLRRQLALVSQHVVLFNGTVRDNLAYGELSSVTDQQVWHALRLANAEEFVRALSNGLDTQLGDNAQLLSGGQRQRLAIARALLKDAPVLLLDEATSALDAASESAIQSALESLMVGRTTLVIAHRLSTIKKADLIVVMEEGSIIEMGTHNSLLEQSGRYAQLYQMQFAQSEIA